MKLNNNILLRTIFITSTIIIISFSAKVSAQKIIVGYYPDYGAEVIPPQDIQFENLTHIVHGFVWPNHDGSLAMYEGIPASNLVALAHQAGVKALLALGGAGDIPTLGFEAIAGDSVKRTTFVNKAVHLADSLGYDGIDLDWEFPDNANERSNYTLLVKEFRKALDEIDASLLLTMASSSTNFYGQWTEYEKIVDDMDFFNLLAYEYNGFWSEKTGHNAPLYNWQNVTDGNGNASVTYLNVTKKIPKDKIVLGIPFYGKMYNSSGLNQTFSDISDDVNVLGLTFRDVLNNIDDTYEYNFDEEAKTPFFISTAQNRFISFDDTNSVRIKTEYAITNGLKGVMIWEITQDKLSDGSQPLLEQIGRTVKSTPTSIVAETEVVPNDYILYNNYPNPFNPTTTISFAIPVVDASRRGGQVNTSTAMVKLKVYDAIGREVALLVNDEKPSGVYKIKFNAEGLSSGIYFYSLITNKTIITNKMILLK